MQDRFWQYKKVEDLKIGDTAIVLKDNKIEEATITSIEQKSGNNVRFYRLNVEHIDNYFAGSVCVHNSEEEKTCESRDSDSVKDPGDYDARAQANAVCGKDLAPSEGCRFTQADQDKAHAEQEALCEKMQGFKCTDWAFGSIRNKVADALRESLKRPANPGEDPDDIPDCPIDDVDFENILNETCESAEECPAPPNPPPPDSCVMEGTIIHTPDGGRSVETLKHGDLVTSYNIDGMVDSSDPSWFLWNSESITGGVSTSTVLYNKNSYWHRWYTILLSDGSKLNITYEHPVLVRAEGIPTI